MLLELQLMKNQTSKRHIQNFHRVANHKFHVSQQIRRYLNIKKAKLLSNAFIYAFNKVYYASVTWISAGKTLISKVKTIHHITLQVVYETNDKSYEDLLLLNDGTSIHQKHLHFSATEIFKSVNIWILNSCGIISFMYYSPQSQFKSRLLGLHVFFAFFRK